MKKVIYAMMICASSAVFAQPNDGESYYIKSFNGHFVYTNGDAFGLGDESQKTAFTMVKNGDKFSLRTPEGRYVSASFKGEDVAGKVVHQPEAQGWEEFSFEKNAEGKYAIKSAQWNSYLRANGDQLDQTDGTPDLWETFELVNVAPVIVTPAEQDQVVAPAYTVTLNRDGGVTISRDGAYFNILSYLTVTAYVIDDSGNLWLATDSFGVAVYNKDDLKPNNNGVTPATLAWFTDHSWAPNKGWFRNNYVTAMHKDNKGQIWIALDAGTFALGGLARYTPSDDGVVKNGKWHLFTKEDGLLSNHVRGFAVENDGSTYVKMMKEGNVPVQMPLADLDNK